jgi:hypothetical protein
MIMNSFLGARNMVDDISGDDIQDLFTILDDHDVTSLLANHVKHAYTSIDLVAELAVELIDETLILFDHLEESDVLLLDTVDIHLHCFEGLRKSTVELLRSSIRISWISVFEVEKLLNVVLLVETNLLEIFSNKLLFFFQVLVLHLDLLKL